MIAFFVWAGGIKDEPYSEDNVALAYQDALLCLEMPLFAWMHWYAFPWTDYKDTRLSSRLQVYYAFRDCIGYQDIIYDTKQAFPDLCDPCACLTSFFFPSRRRGPIHLEEDESSTGDLVAPLRRDAGYARYGIHDPLSREAEEKALEFILDDQEEEEYRVARHLVFGDYNFPVIHEAWRHPPDVQVRIDANATRFYDNLRASVSQDSLARAEAGGRSRTTSNAPLAEDLWKDDDENAMLIGPSKIT